VITASVLVPQPTSATSALAAAYVYTAPDAQTTAYVLPTKVRDNLAKNADDGHSILVVRIEGDCHVTTTTLDMTPRTDSGDVINVPTSITTSTNAKIAALEADMNTATPETNSRCLWAGLLSARIPHDVPVRIFTNGIDLTSPVDFRELAWETTPQQVIEVVEDAEAVPDLKGADVEFFLAAPTGGQEMRATETHYLHSIWSGLLATAGAASVTFTDGVPGTAASTEQVPIVPLPALPGTPVPPERDPVVPERFSCTLQTSAGFVADTANLLDEDAVRQSLVDCVSRIEPGSTVHVDGWVAYFGPIGADGKPTEPGDVRLSQARADKIKAVLISMGVPGDTVTTKGWGAESQVDPEHPSSANNRVCVITVTPPNKGSER
jgi:outer membrane protein OmpA-like peptidoglycan-associated protein